MLHNEHIILSGHGFNVVARAPQGEIKTYDVLSPQGFFKAFSHRLTDVHKFYPLGELTPASVQGKLNGVSLTVYWSPDKSKITLRFTHDHDVVLAYVDVKPAVSEHEIDAMFETAKKRLVLSNFMSRGISINNTVFYRESWGTGESRRLELKAKRQSESSKEIEKIIIPHNSRSAIVQFMNDDGWFVNKYVQNYMPASYTSIAETLLDIKENEANSKLFKAVAETLKANNGTEAYKALIGQNEATARAPQAEPPSVCFNDAESLKRYLSSRNYNVARIIESRSSGFVSVDVKFNDALTTFAIKRSLADTTKHVIRSRLEDAPQIVLETKRVDDPFRVSYAEMDDIFQRSESTSRIIKLKTDGVKIGKRKAEVALGGRTGQLCKICDLPLGMIITVFYHSIEINLGSKMQNKFITTDYTSSIQNYAKRLLDLQENGKSSEIIKTAIHMLKVQKITTNYKAMLTI
jgi:hypothetical protein